jgi:glycosyltransferase involved in cell wall biosynthesis
MNQVVIIPTLEPGAALERLVTDLADAGFGRIIIVDDGSGHAYDARFESLERSGCEVVRHQENEGKGAAIKSGIAHMRKVWPDAPAAVTVDGDGQHAPADVVRVCKAAERHPGTLVIGVRDLKGAGVPLRSRLGAAFSTLYFRLDTGVSCQDTQTGLRVIPAALFGAAGRCEGERYEYEMNFLTQEVRAGVPLLMVPIATVYEKGNASSHFDTLRDSYRIYRSFFRFVAASMLCAAVDLSLFALLTFALGTVIAFALAEIAATVIARLVSGVVNFSINRTWSFDAADGHGRRQAVRYAALFFTQMGLSALGTVILSTLLPAVVAKVVVDVVLFFISYFVQRHWVFAETGAPAAASLKGGVHAYTLAQDER